MLAGIPGKSARRPPKYQEGQRRNSRCYSQCDHQEGRQTKRPRKSGKLAEQRAVGGCVCTGLGDQQAGRDRDNQRRNLGHEAIADGQQCIGISRIIKGQVLLSDADNHTANDIDKGDQQSSDGVAPHELCSAVHGAVKVAFVL